MSPPVKPAEETNASRIATAGIVIALASTAAGMLLHSPVLGGIGLVVVLLAVLLRHPLARLISPRDPQP